MLSEGTRVDGYRIDWPIGHGATSTVYAAMQLSLDRRVALKLLDRGAAVDESTVARFEREGRTQAGLDHPAILSVLEAGDSDHGRFLITRLIDGSTLAELLARGELPPGRTLALLDQVADALDFAHSAGLVHRDVKPRNVLVDGQDRAFLADFGLVRAVSEETYTSAGQVFGTVAYLAPEVIQGERASEASDRYSFAAMTFECLSGRVPFAHPVTPAVLYAHLSERPPRISEVRRDLPRALDSVLATGLNKKPSRRPGTCREFLAQVCEAFGEKGAANLPPPTSKVARGDGRELPRPRKDGRWRRPIAVAGAAAAVAVSVAAAAFLIGGSDSTGVGDAPPLRGIALGGSVHGDGVATSDCRGASPGPTSPGCTVLQRSLPDARLESPADGRVVAWHVTGATGELRLQIIRRVGGRYREVVGGSPRNTDGGSASFTEDIRVERGDLVGLQLSPGAGIGTRPAQGATTLRWFEALGHSRSPAAPTFGARSGFDREVALRVDIEPGRRPTQPTQLRGASARRLGPGTPLDAVPITLGGRSYEIRARSREDNDLWLELVRNGDRRAAIYLIAIDARPRITRFEPLEVAQERGGVHLYFRVFDRTGGGEIHHEFRVTPKGFELLS